MKVTEVSKKVGTGKTDSVVWTLGIWEKIDF